MTYLLRNTIFTLLCILCIPSIQTLHAVPSEERLLLITGCGRSGTVYMMRFLKKSGLKVGHEHHMEEHGIVSWLMATTTRDAPWGPSPRKYTFKHTFHQVRNPLKVMQSYYNSPTGAGWEWIQKSVPEIQTSDSKIVKCAKFWIYWNLLAEAKAEWTYRIEDFDTLYQAMGDRLGLQFDPAVLDLVSTHINTKDNPGNYVITWALLKDELPPQLYNDLVALAQKYGYTTEDES